MISKLFQPPCNVVVGLMFADVVHEERSDGAAVVRGGDGSIALLTSCIPDLCFDGLGINLDGPCGELNPNGGLGVKIELVACETTQEIRFADTGVTNEDDWVEVSA